MDRAWLASQLDAGRSIESIAREVGKHPSTVSYWLKKHGLTSRYAEFHSPRGALAREQLERLIERDLSVREIAEEVARSPATVRYWMGEYGLRTTARGGRPERKTDVVIVPCARHGGPAETPPGQRTVCPRCRIDAVTQWRRRAKRILVDEAGGHCALCGYDRCISALEFHHVEPAQKRFGLGSRGLARSIDRLREEARKCVLLCSNCHAEVEAGFVALPQPLLLIAGNPSGVAHLPG
jgi:transposase-like protein